MTSNVTLTISKLDAARRQLEVAVRLYFFEDDPVSIYTLSGAAYEVLSDIASSKGFALQTIEKSMWDRVKPGKERELHVALSRHKNFFKHADRDPDATIDFKPASVEWQLFDCCVAYSNLTGEITPLMSTLVLWWRFHNRDLIEEEHSEYRVRLERHLDYFENRRTYFAEVFPMLSQRGA
jgi:hypothetical protein